MAILSPNTVRGSSTQSRKSPPNWPSEVKAVPEKKCSYQESF